MTTMTQVSSTPRMAFSSRVCKIPYFEATRRYGCKAYSIYNRMYIPLYYEDPVADYWHLVNGVAVSDIACEQQAEIIGPDVFRFVRRLTSRNLTECASQCKYVLLTAEDGEIIEKASLCPAQSVKQYLI